MSNNDWWTQRLRRREVLVGATAIASGAVLVSCNDASPQPTTTQKARRHTIALVMGIQNDSFYITMQKGAQARAAELGVTFIADAPVKFDPALQTPIVEKMVAQHVDAILIAACDKEVMIEPLKHAYDAGIKIISLDTSIGDGDYVHGPVSFPLSYIGSNNFEGGKIAGNALIKAIGGKGKIYIQNVKPSISAVMLREQGFRSAIEATKGAVTVVAVDYNNSNSDTATEQTASILQHVNDLSAIFGCNMPSAQGAARAVKDAKKEGTIKVAAIDAPDNAIMDLRNGVINMAIAQKPAEMGRIGVEYAIKALSGETSNLDKRVVTGFVIIDKNNIDTPQAQDAIYRSK
ncbi:MAG: substrate-binding domain-containing protein [Chloroflexi bacterium]|nr:MAG: substrate-binding domain-containing protein [Chloroflexota bacterium]